MLVAVEWVDIQMTGILVQCDTLYQVMIGRQYVDSAFGQWHIPQCVEAGQVLHRDTQLLHQLIRDRFLQSYVIGILHLLRFLVCLTVQIHDTVLDL